MISEYGSVPVWFGSTDIIDEKQNFFSCLVSTVPDAAGRYIGVMKLLGAFMKLFTVVPLELSSGSLTYFIAVVPLQVYATEGMYLYSKLVSW